MAAPSKKDHFIVILCGGTGPRLWPLSRVSRPKQFLKILGSHSLLQDTVLRSLRLVPKSHLYLVTNFKYASLIKKDLKALIDPKNILVEPQKKNTTLAIVYAAAVIARISPKAIISTFPSDHHISDLTAFDKNMAQVKTEASLGKLALLGIKPQSPNPSYGYLRVNSKDKKNIEAFIEKPDEKTAQKFIKNPAYYWNSGIYTFKIDTLLEELRQHAPSFLPLFDQLYTAKNPKTINQIYSLSPSLAFDYAISEKSKNMTLIPVKFSWSDIGAWSAIYQKLAKDKYGHALIPPPPHFVSLDSQNCLISAPQNKLVALLDVDSLTIIDTPDALLVTRLTDSSSFRVRDLISKIVNNPLIKHFFTGQHD